MRHRRKVPKLSMTRSRRRSVLAGQAKALILNGKVDTTSCLRRSGLSTRTALGATRAS